MMMKATKVMLVVAADRWPTGRQFCTLRGQTVVTRSISTYRTELSLCQQMISFSSNTAVSIELSDLSLVWRTDVRRQLRLIFRYT